MADVLVGDVMWRRKKASALENALPRGSWFDEFPEFRERDGLGDLVIEVYQLEAVLTGILGLNEHQLAVATRAVATQFAEVDAELRRVGSAAAVDELRAYVQRLRDAYEEYVAERTPGD